MKVLVVSAHFPFPPRSGVKMRNYQLTRQLARRHEVTLLCYAWPEDRDGVEPLREELPVRIVERGERSRIARRWAQLRSLASVEPFSARLACARDMQQALDELCASESFDIVQLETSVLCALSVPANVKVVLDSHNIEYEVFQRMGEGETAVARRAFNRLEYERFRRFEQRCWRRVHGCAVTSDREEPIIRAYAPSTPIAVVPNAVDLDTFAPSAAGVEPGTVVFNGTLDYRPNVDAAQHLVEEIWPLVLNRYPKARLTIVGRGQEADLRRLRRPGVTVTGEVPDVRPYLTRAAIVAVPVRIGGGTRLKVVEGLACGKAIVSTSLGCEGIAVRDREHLLIADDAQAFAVRLLELFTDPGLGQALGAAGRRLAESQYSWELAGDRLEELYGRVVRQAARQVPSARPQLAPAPGPDSV
jgi:polysaccharide biosynthesis protein PslH